ncbi:MAG: RHS repeat-associated core domain-containing protein, partial [Thermodesulfobacteriota bacterium]
QGRLIADQNPEGHGIACEYDALNRVTLYVDRAGNEWRKVYDDAGLKVEYISPDGETTLETLNEHGDVIHIQYADGSDAASSYDGSGNPITVTTATGLRIRRSYNPEGDLVEESDQQGFLQRIGYNQSRRPERSWQRGRGETSFDWDPENRISQVTDAKGRTTQYQYTHFNKLHRIIMPGGVTLAEGNIAEVSKTYFYDTENRVVEVAFLGGEKARFHYDVGERPVGFDYPDGRKQRCERDGRGCITRLFENGDLLFEQECDSAGRPLRRITGDGDELSYEYDPFGNVVNASGSDGIGAVEIEYDQIGRQLSEEGVFGKFEKNFSDWGNTQNYVWNDDLKLTFSSLTVQSGTVLTGGRPSLDDVKLRYDENNRLLRSDFSNGAFQSLAYGEGYKPNSQTRFAPSHGETQRDYHYDSEELLTGIDENGSPWRRYERDELDRLISMARWDDTDKQKYVWRFDRFGNRTISTNPGGEPFQNQYADGHRLTKAGEDEFTYDSHGRVISWTDGEGRTKHFDWNAIGQLRLVELDDGNKVEMRYDALGRRVEKITSEGATKFSWNNDLMVHETHPDGEERHYLYHPDSYAPLACYIKSPNDEWRLHTFFNDAIGMPETMADDRGQVVWHSEMMPFGEMLETQENKLSQAIAMPGQYRDEEIGLHYNFFRYYLPKAGTYISPDPIGIRGGDNVYAYVEDPVCWSDPLGLSGDDYSKTAEEMAEELSDQIGKNSVSFTTQHQTGHIDLRGKSHFDKKTQTSIPTPHVQTRDLIIGPNNQISAPKKTEITRPATKQDIRIARRIAKNKGLL